MIILIAGDFCDNGRVTQKIHDGDYKSIFESVKPVVEASDFSIVNFEFPIVQGDGKPITKCGPCLKGQKEAIDAIKYAGFKVCTLANNHILDQGAECCLNTKRLLEEAGMKTVGVGENLNAASEILYLEKGGEKLAVINCCEHEFSIATETSPGANPLNPVQQYYKIQEAKKVADYVLVIVHGGHEHYQLPSPRMKELYRYFINVGADAVVNHHQHCFSGYEVYNGKPIFYGLGNFCFDGNRTDKDLWHYGFMLNLSFTNTGGPKYEMTPYIQCKDDVTVMPLKNDEERGFKEKIDELNYIIANDELLSQSFQEWCKTKKVAFDNAMTPYTHQQLLSLCRHHIIPSFIRKSKILKHLNNVDCEAHRDTFIYYLKHWGE